MVKIKWTNKYSNETGFVKDINNKEKHFVNTFDEAEAKVFKNVKAANTAISKLIEFGEGNNNNFEVIEVKDSSVSVDDM